MTVKAGPIIQAVGLTKKYGSFTAVDHLDLSLEEGQVYGFLGPNGSGKSTTILMFLGLTEPTEGFVSVCGYDPTHHPLEVKRQVGYLPESVGFYGDLTGRENLLYTASLNKIEKHEATKRIVELLDMVELSGATDQPVGQYSRGMRQRLGLADVLLKEPRVVILDDPTLGLDPTGIQWLLGLIEEMSAGRNITVFLSSHQMQEVQRVCHMVGIMSRGKLVLEGSLDQLMASGDGKALHLELIVKSNPGKLKGAISRLGEVIKCEMAGNVISVQSNSDIRNALMVLAIEEQVELLELQSRNTTLEEIYLKYFTE
jgi:ABC-2 type transport system ATP-binding protein